MESGFHDNVIDEAFLLVDENLKRIAHAQAQVILEALGVKLSVGPAPELIIDALLDKVEIASPDYWVQVLKGKEQVNVKFLNTLLARFAGFDV